MNQEISTERLAAMRGDPVYDSAGEKIGHVEELYLDNDTRQPEWIGIGTGFLGTKRAVVPVAGIEQRDDGLLVPYTKEHVKDAPGVDADEISYETEDELTRYYTLGSGTEASGKRAKGQQVTRSEEELHVGKEQRRAGRARLRKWVETEPVEMDVELKRETARVTRERIDQPVSGAEIGEQEIDVELREERPVVEKRTVAKERVGLETDVETERQTVADEVRKERVEVDTDAARRKR